MVYQYCDNHTDEIYQINAEINHKCPICGGVMTFGKWSNRTPDREFEGLQVFNRLF